ncbi:MAG: hypothetical protein IVW52_04130 [Acidimicrobiales bacterium]|nr:hypothetical protein [Acidimicrobiales bacterium]
MSLVLPNGEAIAAGATYSNQPGVAIEVDPPFGRCTGNGTYAAIQVDQVTHDSTGLTTSYAIQFFCDVGNGTSYTGALAYNVSPTTPHQGYYAYESNGTITGFGNDNYLNYLGDLSVVALNKPIVGMAITADAAGYWMVTSDGGIFAYGDAGFYGSMGGQRLNRPVVGIAATPDGQGYWLVASDGGVFAFGDAPFFGSMGGRHLNKPMVGLAPSPSGGYWMVASDGGVFSFHAPFYGSTGALRLNQPVAGMAPTPHGNGYWFVAADGGIFSFGDAGFYGSTGAIRLNRPIVGMAPMSNGSGYWLVASDGGVFAFNAPFYGSLAGLGLTGVVGIAS